MNYNIQKYAVSAVVCLVAVLAISVGSSVNTYASWLNKQTLVTVTASPTDTIYANSIIPSTLFSSRFYMLYTKMSADGTDPKGVRTQAYFITSNDSGATWSSATLIYDHITNGLGYIQCMRARNSDGTYRTETSNASLTLTNTVGNSTTEYIHVLINVSSEGPNCNFYGDLDQNKPNGAVYVRIINTSGSFTYGSPSAIATPSMPTGVTFQSYCFFQCNGANLARFSLDSATAMIVSTWDGTIAGGSHKKGFFFLYSQDNGATWSSPTLVKDDQGSTTWTLAAEVVGAISSSNNVCIVAAGIDSSNFDDGFGLYAIGGTFTDITGNMVKFTSTGAHTPSSDYDYDEPSLINGRNSGEWIVAFTKVSISPQAEFVYFKRHSNT